jgi:hypothetical protein
MVIPDELVGQVIRGDVVLFVGAGLSQGAGLPGWRALLALSGGFTGAAEELK